MLLNQPRAVEFMKSSGLDAVVATSPYNVEYMTGYECWLASASKEFMVIPGGSGRPAQRNFALLPADGEPALVVEPYFLVDTAELWVRDVRTAGGGDFEMLEVSEPLPAHFEGVFERLQLPPEPDPLAVIASVIEERELARGRIGVEMDGWADEDRRKLQQLLPHAELADATNLFRLVRAVKTDEEIRRLERAATIAEDAAMTAYASAEVGRTIAEVAQAYRARLGELGASFEHFALGPRGLGVSSHGRYVLCEDDVMFADWGCVADSYFSDTGTTLSLAPLGARLRGRHAAIRDCLLAGADAIAPGVRSSAVQAVMTDALAQSGISGSFPFGHGFGIEARDYPILVPENGLRITDGCVDVESDLPLETGMVVNLEVPVFTLGVGSMQTEQSFVVTGSGSRPLISQERDRPLVLPAPKAQA